ncbi:hypothetical protein CcaverHIS002_0208440 [Cutaneotrichosporon cavernicola]|uniref:Uncharacterized protein n=1 Tax=Cutaneotrichosporon cavernicola TaxID=279322 RepID=A0AA48L2L9_9TREE|nr:uncharacterized protein CcaverHIS019_0208450 [Cutaneotrichosporon cavernicola]BEI81684.1 hypothetical protein CcaverHIS002_0208440 [Cutaneotrichosporon cavernicola]BEI89483.1 hypothetical protein CcaverHIS019_0208450 [Cutaneotrichosporon cavernicola]BEI97256.1 hypothetical protein CcaverHIS631_0208450 [Cutaneotrichosporon cavernicola]BEJ05030.1 hypothetical protein CcaverHIS641_0208470 [Cutaneotrichosporon cavernicola]
MSVAIPTATSPSRCPHSILRPCSSVVQPSKDAAGNRQFGWLAAPPRELCCPRPSPVIVEQVQTPTPTSTTPAHSPTDETETETETETVPPLSPSVSQDSVAESSPSIPESLAGDETPRSAASPSIRFSVLPERPPELRRRNSISLGVLARKSMLHAQGSTPGRGQGQGQGIKRVVMTDDEWEAYQRQFAAKNQIPQAVDLGAVMKSGAKTFFTKLRRSNSSASTSSNGSATSRSRSDSSSSSTGGSHHVAAVPAVPEVPEIPEEEEGDETPRTGRSPSPTHMKPSLDPNVFEETGRNNSLRLSTDDTEYEHLQHSNTEAALGFDLTHYPSNARPAFQRSVSEA